MVGRNGTVRGMGDANQLPVLNDHTDWDAYYQYLGHFYKLEEAKALFGTFVEPSLDAETPSLASCIATIPP